MKKLTKALSVSVIAVMAALALCACGGSSGSSSGDSDSLSGSTYAFSSYTVDGEDQTELMTEMYSEMTLAFEDDGVCIQTITWSEEYAELLGVTDPVEQEGTYEEDGDSVTVTFESDEGDTVMEFVIEDDTLTMDEDGYVTTYTLQ